MMVSVSDVLQLAACGWQTHPTEIIALFLMRLLLICFCPGWLLVTQRGVNMFCSKAQNCIAGRDEVVLSC